MIVLSNKSVKLELMKMFNLKHNCIEYEVRVPASSLSAKGSLA